MANILLIYTYHFNKQQANCITFLLLAFYMKVVNSTLNHLSMNAAYLPVTIRKQNDLSDNTPSSRARVYAPVNIACIIIVARLE